MQNLDPDLLQQLLAAITGSQGPITIPGAADNDWAYTRQQTGWTGGDAGSASGPMETHFYRNRDDKQYDVFGGDGTFQGTEKKGSVTDQWVQFLATAAAMYGGANALNGLMNGGGIGGMTGGPTADPMGDVFGFADDAIGTGGGSAGGYAGGVTGADPFAALGGGGGYAPGFSGLGENTLAGMSGMSNLPPMDFGGTLGNLTLPAAGGSSLFSGITDALGGTKGLMTAAGLLGGIGGAQGGADVTSSNKRTLDPRLDSAIFGANGQNGLLSRVLDFANNNPTGQNDTMRQASERQKALLNDPRVWGGLSNIYGQSQGLLNQGVAPNPFANWKP